MKCEWMLRLTIVNVNLWKCKCKSIHQERAKKKWHRICYDGEFPMNERKTKWMNELTMLTKYE